MDGLGAPMGGSFRQIMGAGMYGEDWGCGEADFVGKGLDVG